jgi:hypothetical protein
MLKLETNNRVKNVKNICLARKLGGARQYNQGEVENLLKKYGFETIYLES